MNTFARKLSSLQAPIGGFGFLVWMTSFQAFSWLRDNEFIKLAEGASGYTLGFATAFAGWVALHLFKGNGSKFIDDSGFFKWLSVFILAIIALCGLAGFAIDIFGNTSWQFNIGFFIGGFVMGACFGPIIDATDNL